jgi:predicted nucleotidyltransferase
MLDSQLWNQMHAIFDSFPEIKRVILFGSRARGDASERSDIDLAVETTEMSQKQWLQLVAQLEEDLETLLSIDISKVDEASLELKERICKEGKIIYERAKSQAKP